MRLHLLVALVAVSLLNTCSHVAAQGRQATSPAPAKARVAVLNEDFPGSDPGLVQAISTALSNQAQVSAMSADELAAALAAQPATLDAVIFPNAVYLPTGVKDPLIAFLKQSGDMIAIGGPAFSEVVTKTDGRWVPGEKDKNTKIDPNSPIFESLSPAYQTFSVTADKLSPNPGYADWAFSSEIPGPVSVVSPVWRTRGLGIGVEHPTRWIPLMFAMDKSGDWKGTASAIRINRKNDFPNSIWGYIGFTGEPYRDMIATAAGKMLSRMTSGAFLMDAGSDKFGYFQGDSARIGGDIYRVGALAKPALKLQIISSIGPIVFEETVPLRLERKVAAAAEVVRRFRSWKADYIGRFQTRVDLLDGDRVVDTIIQPFTVAPSDRKPSELVSVKDGDFYLNGGKWYPKGVNYWPKYVIGSNEGLEWLTPVRYDPEIVEHELAQIENLGYNTASIQYLRESEAPALVDFMERCRRHNLKAHIFIEGFHPLRPNTKKALSLIKAAKLDQNDAVWTYDLAWEPIIGPEADRKQWNGKWQGWVIERYGSVESAVKDWGYQPPSENGVISGPTDSQLYESGPHGVMVAAYRRFWDDTINSGYASVVSDLRALDKVHLVGARSGYGGTGSFNVVDRMPFDLASGAKHLDFISPESWYLAPAWPEIASGGINTAYGRLVGAGKPVYWAEIGYSIWPDYSQSKLDKQAAFYNGIYRMMAVSGANGGSAWWWPGGYRVGENTDFGITNPDGTARPAALEVKTFVPAALPTEQYVIMIDRDKYVTGYAGIYKDVLDEYVKNTLAGKHVVLKTEGTGTTSLSAPKLAVGDKPLTGSNPPRFLNAEIVSFGVGAGKGRFLIPREKQVFHVGKNKPVQVKLTVGNTAEAEWLALPADQEGAVVLLATTSDGRTFRTPISKNTGMFSDLDMGVVNVVPSVSAQTTVTLQMEAVGRSVFGPKIQFTAAP